jgi:hypothetical protein
VKHDFKVGDECSYGINGDRYPVMVSRVTPTRVYTQPMQMKCIKPHSSYGSEDAVFEFYPPNENAKEQCFTVKKGGRVSVKGHGFGGLSHGAEYRQNPSF